MKHFYKLVVTYPKSILLIIVLVSVWMFFNLNNLRWETDARVYMPSGHPAIKYDEKIEELFGVRDALIVVIKNDSGIYNPETLERVERLTAKISKLDPIVANRDLDVVSLSTATVFSGNDTELVTERVMPKPPATMEDLENLRRAVVKNSDILIGNVVSADEKVTVIRAKVKEGAVARYQAYWQIRALIQQEQGQGGDNWRQWWGGGSETWSNEESQPEISKRNDGNWGESDVSITNGDELLIAGRPAIEVTSGLNAISDIKTMLPMLAGVMAVILLVIFKTGRGVFIPLIVMSLSVIWTLGVMAAFDVPMYTISTMLPVVLVAVGIADSVHLLNRYYTNVLESEQPESANVVYQTLTTLGPPLLITTVTTGIGFLALLFAEMPPFKVFGIFTLIGVLISWLLTVALAGALLTIMKPKVGGYLAKRRALRVYEAQDKLSYVLARLGSGLLAWPVASTMAITGLLLIGAWGATSVTVNSSWMSDFKKESEVSQATEILNTHMSGATVLNVVVEAENHGAFKSQALLKKLGKLQEYADTLSGVGSTLSIVDYISSMNKVLHSDDEAYNILPATDAEVAGYLYLYSISGQPELLDEVIDYGYKTANLSVIIRTDQTAVLRTIIDSIDEQARLIFEDELVSVNYAGSGNNSYVWADLLIQSQGAAILFSKIAILILALLIFRRVAVSLMIVLPVTLATVFVAGGAGWLSVPLDVSTALAAGLAIGVGVDYAVHYTFHFIAALKQESCVRTAIISSMANVGRAIVINAVVVVAGFSVLLLSEFPPHAKLGIFVVIYMLLSCLIALVVLPLLSLLVRSPLKVSGVNPNAAL